MFDFEEDEDMPENIELMTITDREQFSNDIRRMAAEHIGQSLKQEELDKYITLSQVEQFVDDFSDSYEETTGNPIITRDSFEDICDTVCIMMQNVGIAQLAAQGVIEVAFDDKTNDFIFWYEPEKAS